jgi:hypothetical protein
MKLHLKAATYAIVALSAVVFYSAAPAGAATIIKLSLGNSGPDVQFNGVVFSTSSDGVVPTTGDQDTAAEFQDFLNFQPDLPGTNPGNTGSYTLAGVTVAGAATNVFGNVVQPFSGGNFFLYAPAPGNALLLSGQLSNSVLFGTIGPPGTGAVFTTSIASVTGGSLGPFILPNSLSLSISMTNVNGGAGFQLSDGVLLPFHADVTQTIAGDAPEPSSVFLAMLGSALCGAYFWKRN